MVMRETGGHPWMGNSLPDIKQRMLAEIGVDKIEALFEQIPQDHRLKTPLDLPLGIKSESALRRHLDRHAGQERERRHQPDLPRRRLLAASRAGRGG